MKMKPLTIDMIARAVGGELCGDPAISGTLITGVVHDSRDVQPGNLFVCIGGERFDGHDFAESTHKSGAVCCLAEREVTGSPYILVDSTLRALRDLGEYYRSLFDIPVIGVTGSVGKTTAKEMIASVLSQKYNVLKTPANLNNEIGVPLTLLSLREDHEAAIIEMGISDFGEMHRLSKMVRPDICLMTTIGYCHLDNLGDLNGVLKAKSEVFDFMQSSGYAILSGDDELLRIFDPGVNKITFGLDSQNDYYAKNIINHGISGITCDIINGETVYHVDIPAFGSHMVLGALPAVIVGNLLGLSPEMISRGLLTYIPVGGRANIQDTGFITLIDDCYNANPNSVTASILSLCTLEGKKIAILGDMKELGRDSKALHREIGMFCGKCGVDSLICCGEMAEFIYKGLISTGISIEAWHFPLKSALLSVLPSLVKSGDNVLVKASHSMQFEEIVEELKRLS